MCIYKHPAVEPQLSSRALGGSTHLFSRVRFIPSYLLQPWSSEPLERLTRCLGRNDDAYMFTNHIYFLEARETD